MTPALLLGAVLPMLVFAGFIALSLRVRIGDTPARSRPLRLLIAYVVVVSLFAGLRPKDLWPFAAWHYVPYAIGDSGRFLQAVSVDENGREHPLDPRAFEPLELAELMGFLDYGIEHMPRTERSELLQFMHLRAQEGLARVRTGLPAGTFSRFLGPLSAPMFQAEAAPWTGLAELPRELTDLRVYRVYWRISGSTARIEKRELVANTRS